MKLSLVVVVFAISGCTGSGHSGHPPDPGPGGKGDTYWPPPDAPAEPPDAPAVPPDAPVVPPDAPACVLGTTWPFGSPACTACVQQSCCEQVNACENSQVCNAYVSCRLQCILAGQHCLDQCDAQYPDQVAVYQTFTMCVANADCSSVCQ